MKETRTSDVENPGPDLGQVQNYGGVKPISGMLILHLLKWISNGNTDMNKH